MMCCYHPTRIVAIDDDENFLKTMRHHLGLSNCILFTSPITAMQSLCSSQSFKRIQSRLLKVTRTLLEASNSVLEHYALTTHLLGLYEEIYSIDRFHDVSVLIIDYHMGSISGIDVCQQLAHHPAKKFFSLEELIKKKLQ